MQHTITSVDDNHLAPQSQNVVSRKVEHSFVVLRVEFRQLGSLGFRLGSKDANVNVRGVVFNAQVTKVSGQAQEVRVETGMVIVQINDQRQAACSPSATMACLAEALSVRPVRICFVRPAQSSDATQHSFAGDLATLATFATTLLNKPRIVTQTPSTRPTGTQTQPVTHPTTFHNIKHRPTSAPPPPVLPTLSADTRQRMRNSLTKSAVNK